MKKYRLDFHGIFQLEPTDHYNIIEREHSFSVCVVEPPPETLPRYFLAVLVLLVLEEPLQAQNYCILAHATS